MRTIVKHNASWHCAIVFWPGGICSADALAKGLGWELLGDLQLRGLAFLLLLRVLRASGFQGFAAMQPLPKHNFGFGARCFGLRVFGSLEPEGARRGPKAIGELCSLPNPLAGKMVGLSAIVPKLWQALVIWA